MSQSNKVPSRQDWTFGNLEQDFSKESLIDIYVRTTLIRTNQMFRYSGLPDTIPKKDLEFLLQVYGHATITKVDDKLYAFRGGLGGVPNAYYLPTISIVANPYLKFNKTLKIGEDCVVGLNDTMYMGLMPLIKKFAYLSAECDISFKFASINSRVPAIVNTPDDTSRETALEFFKQVEEGKKLGVCLDGFGDSISVYDYASKGTSIKELIELKQYLKGTFENEIGIMAQFNMKREAINEAEASMGVDILYPLVDDMLEQRKLMCDRINAMYGTNISVELNSVWEDLRQEKQLANDLKASEIELNEAMAQEDTEEVEVSNEVE